MSKELTTWEKSLSQGHSKFLKTMNYDSNNVPQEVKQKASQEIGFAYQSMLNNPMLQKCDPASIVNAITNIARTSITLNPVMRMAYLVPRKGKCILDFSYMGMVSMLKNNGNIRTINAYIVYEDETFEHNIVDNVITHKPVYKQTEKEHNNRAIIGAYSIAKLPSGDVDYCFMPMWEINKVKSMSQGSDSPYSAWNTWKDEMIKKTVIKRHFKMLISVNDAYNSKLSAILEIENENNPLEVQGKSYQTSNRMRTAFIEEEKVVDVSEANSRLNQIIENPDIEENLPEINSDKVPVKKENKVEYVGIEKVDNPTKVKNKSVKRKKTEIKEVEFESVNVPDEIIDHSTGEIIPIDEDKDLITDEMVAEITANDTTNQTFEEEDLFSDI